MSELKQNLKDLVIKGIDAIGNTASSLKSSTKQKVNELALRSRRNDILEAFGEKAYEAWKNGAELPEELTGDLKEVLALDQELEQLKDNRNGSDDPEECPEAKEEAEETAEPEEMIQPEEADDPEEPEGPEEPEKKIPVIEVPKAEDHPVKDIPLSDAIDQLFGNKPQMEEMAGKINSSLDEMGKQLLQFSNDFGKNLSDMADELMGQKDQKD